MKNYRIVVESYFANNSDFKEYDVYYLDSESLESAKSYTKKVLDYWNTKSKEVLYFMHDIEEV